MWIGLAILFAGSGIGIAYALFRTGRLLRRTEVDLHRTVDEVVPILAKTGTSMDQVNRQLGKVDVMLDSAVDMTEAIDTSVRAVSHAITEPVRAVSSAMAGAAETARSFRDRVAGDRPETAATQAAAGAATASDDPARPEETPA